MKKIFTITLAIISSALISCQKESIGGTAVEDALVNIEGQILKGVAKTAGGAPRDSTWREKGRFPGRWVGNCAT